MKIIQNTLVSVAVLFGIITVFAGASVLLGVNPGYTVFKPLLIYNTLMGFAYLAAGITAYRHIKPGIYIASVIFLLNAIVLATLFFLHSKGNTIAVDSLRAMSLRTGVWLILFTGFLSLDRNKNKQA